jgi:hypothetical protein
VLEPGQAGLRPSQPHPRPPLRLPPGCVCEGAQPAARPRPHDRRRHHRLGIRAPRGGNTARGRPEGQPAPRARPRTRTPRRPRRPTHPRNARKTLAPLSRPPLLLYFDDDEVPGRARRGGEVQQGRGRSVSLSAFQRPPAQRDALAEFTAAARCGRFRDPLGVPWSLLADDSGQGRASSTRRPGGVRTSRRVFVV